jgi:hypothetical protein
MDTYNAIKVGRRVFKVTDCVAGRFFVSKNPNTNRLTPKATQRQHFCAIDKRITPTRCYAQFGQGTSSTIGIAMAAILPAKVKLPAYGDSRCRRRVFLTLLGSPHSREHKRSTPKLRDINCQVYDILAYSDNRGRASKNPASPMPRKAWNIPNPAWNIPSLSRHTDHTDCINHTDYTDYTRRIDCNGWHRRRGPRSGAAEGQKDGVPQVTGPVAHVPATSHRIHAQTAQTQNPRGNAKPTRKHATQTYKHAHTTQRNNP